MPIQISPETYVPVREALNAVPGNTLKVIVPSTAKMLYIRPEGSNMFLLFISTVPAGDPIGSNYIEVTAGTLTAFPCAVTSISIASAAVSPTVQLLFTS